jgi:hypothetical protein
MEQRKIGMKRNITKGNTGHSPKSMANGSWSSGHAYYLIEEI